MEGAALQIIETPGRVRFRTCAVEVIVERPVGPSPCGSVDVERLEGEALVIQAGELR